MGYRWIGKPVAREDAHDKVTGKTKYMTDLAFPGLAWGTIVRSGVPHAEILAIDTAEAENCPGVLAVVTHRDVPGCNAYGIACDDQPVFCRDRIRYEGDPVAGVVAETRDRCPGCREDQDCLSGVARSLRSPRGARRWGSPGARAGEPAAAGPCRQWRCGCSISGGRLGR